MEQPFEYSTACGQIRGLDFGDHREYRGIRYAAAGRWEYPQRIDRWNGTYDATRWGDCCYQRRSFENDAVCNKFYHHEFREGMTFTYSEDSLFLNIWAPETAKNCPVLIYIHGGSFTGGSANEAHISGVEFAKKGIVFVSFNYRLGPFGFCSHPDLTEESGVCGNYGLYDQLAAAAWVRAHIADFGGDAARITLMGQSAGAMSVDIHGSSPLETGWYSSLVMSSGAALQRRLLKPRTPEQTRSFWQAVLTNAGVADMHALKAVSPKALYYAWLSATKSVKGSLACTLPVYDGKLLTRESFTMKATPATPCLLGITANDMLPAALKLCLCAWAKAAEQNGGRCYTYLLDHALPGDGAGAWHSSDLLYFFSTLGRSWRPFAPEDYALSEAMSAALCAFVRAQDPNCDALPRWESGHIRPMVFGTAPVQKPWDTKMLLHNTIKKGRSE